MVRRVGIILGFKAEAEIFVKTDAALSFFAVHEVSGVKLNAGKIGINLKLSSAFFVPCFCNKAQRSAFAVDAEVVVVALALNKLGIVIVYIPTNFFEFPEIKGRSLNGSYFTGGNAVFVRRSEKVAVEHQLMVKDTAVCRCAEIEIGVVGHVDDRFRVRFGFVMNFKLVPVREDIGDLYVNIAGKALLAVRTAVGKFNRVVVGDYSFPQSAAVFSAAVQAGDAFFIFCNVILPAGEGEFSAGYPVCILADNLARLGSGFDVAENVVKAGNDIARHSVAVGADERVQRCAACDDSGRNAAVVFNSIEKNFSAVRHCVIVGFCYAHDKRLLKA